MLKREPGAFKEINKQTRAEISRIRKIKSAEERLVQYKTLSADFNSRYAASGIKTSPDYLTYKLDNAVMTVVAAMAPLSIMIPLVGVVPPLAALVGAVAVPTGFAIRQSAYNSVAQNFGLKARDLKTAVKADRLERKVRKKIDKLAPKAKL